MAVSLTCPSCGAAVSAAESDRGKSTLCGSCWTEVPVPVGSAPAGSAPAKAAPVAARPSSAAPVAVAAVAKPAVAKPVASAPGKPAPMAPVAKDDDLDLDLPSPRSRRRPLDDEDDGDDDRPQGGPKKKGGNSTLLIILGAVAFVLLLGCGGVGYLIYSAVATTQDFVEEVSKPPEGWSEIEMNDGGKAGKVTLGGASGPGLSNANGIPRSMWEKKWAQVAGNGFLASMPDTPRPNNRTQLIDGEDLKGVRYESDEGGVKFNVLYYDVPNEFAFNAGQFIDKSRPSAGRAASTFVKPISVSNYPGSEFTRAGFGQEKETVWVVKVGPRVFQFFTHHDPNWTKNYAGLDPEAKRKQFFDSVAITFDPNTPAPASTVKRPKKENPKTGTPSPTQPKQPTFPPTSPPLPSPGALPPTPFQPPPLAPPTADDSFKLVGRVEPFLTAVALPEQKEILTFAHRGPVGLVRRISPTTYKVIAERVLPSPVTHAVADERTGRLYVATVQGTALVGMEATNRLTATGDIQTYDLAAVLSDAPAQGDLKPLASAGLTAKVVGLEFDPKGKALYAATVFLDRARAKAGPKTQVVKLDAADLKRVGDHDVANPLGTVRLSPDGKTLFAAEFPYNSFGSPQFGSSAPVTVHVYDAVNWKKTHAVTVPHPVMDIRFQTDDKALVVAAGAARMKLLTLDTKGAVADVTPERVRHRGGFAALTPDGKRLVLSGRTLQGSEVFLIDEGRLRTLGFTQTVGNAPPLLGPVVLAPDGKTALYGTGAVVDFSNVGTK